MSEPWHTGRPFPFTRVLVTGAAGFIGSALVWALNRRGVKRIVVADHSSTDTDERRRNLTPLRFERFVDASELLTGLTAGSIGNFDLVLHMGACSSTTERDVAFLTRNNYEYTRQLAEWAISRGVRFVYASSAATYGDGTAGMSDRDDSVEALAPLRPLNAYGDSKHRFDLYAAHAGILDRIVGLKFFNVFGPNESHKGEMRSVVNKAYHQIVAEGRVRLFKSYRADYAHGAQQRDFLYIKDALCMTLWLAAHPAARGIYNIGSGTAHTWLNLAHALFRALRCDPKIEFIDMPGALRETYQYYTRADLTKLRAAGYAAPVTPLEHAVDEYVHRYLLSDRRLGEGDGGHDSLTAP